MDDAGDRGRDDVTVAFYRPAEPLRAAISTYYVVRISGEAPVEDLLHPEWPNIRLPLAGDWALTFDGGRTVRARAPDALITGALSKAALAHGEPGVLVGVGLLPGGWTRLTDQPAADHVDRLSPLSMCMGRAVDDLLARLLAAADDAAYCAALDAWFVARLGPESPESALAMAAHKALVDPEVATVADWARRLGRSTRQLERMSRAFFGLSPKSLLRRQRFLRTFAVMREQPLGAWGRLLDEQYADQPQFIREFRHFIGMSPRAYFSRPWAFMIAAGNARKALLGAPVQALHKLDDVSPG